MKTDITITADPRESRGKNEARRLRVRGLAPAILYGAAKEPVAVAISPKDVSKILRSHTGHNTIFNLDVTGQENSPVMIVDWQNDPVKSHILHVDLKRIDLTKRLIVKIAVHVSGEPVGVKLQGGLLEIVTREIEIECLPEDIPDLFTMDVTALSIGQGVRASDVPVSGSMKLLSPADQVIAHIVAMRAVEEVAVVPGAEPVAAAGAEPEVIKKGKKDEEGAAPEAKKKK